jgi:hypothetical protein
MAELPIEITTTVLELQRRLLTNINHATTVEYLLLERYGETEASVADMEMLQNCKESAETYYSRFSTLLLRIAEAQPHANTAMLSLLDKTIAEAEALKDAQTATVQEVRRDWDI